MKTSIEELKEFVNPNLWNMILPTVRDEHLPGTLIECDGYYGTYFLRICAIVSLYKCYEKGFDYSSKIHPSNQGCGGYLTQAWWFPDVIGKIETHLICGFVLEQDNKNWNPKGTKYEEVSKGKPLKKLPITMPEKKYLKWLELVKPVSIDFYQPEELS